MTIAITAETGTLDAVVDNRFGRAKGFIIYNEETTDYTFIDNEQNLQAAQGAGIQSAKHISDAGVQVLITGHVGPKAFAALNQVGIKIYTGAQGTVKDAINQFLAGNLEQADAADVEAHW